MANPAVDAMVQAVAAATAVEDSAIALINGIAKMITDAVAASVANGATAEQLVPVSDAAAALSAKSQALADAVALNTPAAPVQASAKGKTKKP